MSSGTSTLSQPVETDAQTIGAAGDGCAEPRLDRQLRMLDRLAEAGLEIALEIERRVKQADPSEPLAVLTAAAQAFDRVARAVRLCILLQSRLAQERQDPDEAARQAEAQRRGEHTGRVVNIVKRIARDHCKHEPYAVSVIARETAERLDTDDIYGLVQTRPVGELVALICRDFGFKPNWDALAMEGWAQAEKASGVAGSPFVAKRKPARPSPLAGEGDREAVERAFRRDTG